METIKLCFLYLPSSEHNNVVTASLWRRYKTSLWSCHIVAMENQAALPKGCRCNVSLWRLIMICCNDVVVATSSVVSMATIDNLRVESDSHVATTLQQRHCVTVTLPNSHLANKEIIYIMWHIMVQVLKTKHYCYYLWFHEKI